MKTRNNKTIIILLILVILAAVLLGSMIWFMMTHFFVGGRAYANHTTEVDLRDQSVSLREYDRLREKFPDGVIHWNIPFQGSTYPDSAQKLTVSSISDADMEVLPYFTQLKQIDATGCRDYVQLEKLQQKFPDIDVSYTVEIAGREYDKDATEVVCSELTDEQIALMAYLPALKKVNASECQEYERLAVLAEAYPELEISYRVQLLGQTFTQDDTTAVFNDPDISVLQEGLARISALEMVHIVEPSADAQALRQLMEAYPDITITWDKTVLGKTFNSALTEYDLTDLSLSDTRRVGYVYEPMPAEETAQIIQTVEAAMAYFPNAEKVILPAYRFENATVANYRERMRSEYKVVWTVYITGKQVRTDQEVIHSSAYQVCFIDNQSQDLVYCEDAIVVDIGHSYVKNIEWVRGMPNLEYLILTHNWVTDLTPLESCKKLIYLELYWNDYIPDYSPLKGCTALQDLNVSGTYADIEPLMELTWLNNLWANLCGITKAEHEMLQNALPNTVVMTQEGRYTGGGWRQVQNYFNMRDIMGLPYNHW